MIRGRKIRGNNISKNKPYRIVNKNEKILNIRIGIINNQKRFIFD